MTRYEAVIGLEIHVQIKTDTKAFCRCNGDYNAPPNRHICPVCTGAPGALPVLSDEFVRRAVLFCLALGARVNLVSTFDRKNYFYPDMPKNYQITQFFTPIGSEGRLLVTGADGVERAIGIERIHMEEDTARSAHMGERTLLNFNRAGLPLIEVVSHPDLRSGEEAAQYFKKIYDIAVKYLGICRGNMEEGNLRCDANISIRPVGSTALNTKTEVKNVNSFAFIAKAIDHEIERQIALVEAGGAVESETRLWNPKLKRTETMRKKSGRNDYRYFNEPDLGPLRITAEFVEELRKTLPELPDAKRRRLKAYGINNEQTDLFVGYPEVGDYFINATASNTLQPSEYPIVSSLVTGEILKYEDKEHFETVPQRIPPQHTASLAHLIHTGRVTWPQAKELFAMMRETGSDPEEIVKNDPRFTAIGDDETAAIAAAVVADHPAETEKYLGGRENLLGFFVGQAMKRAKGKADPAKMSEMVKKELTNRKK
ncbi:MAG TPA: Asp-tRNA(Asn)/Glu-tRNA(Gln) amidotransferase subunit GatB [bacterium]|nr:Asp-tRNA(Asn)/Glu-tRNA(Gln) amidotransferase subunit GatB [bacterium]